MSVLLDPPADVLLVGVHDGDVERLRERLLEGPADDVDAVAGPDELRDVLRDRDGIACVVGGGETSFVGAVTRTVRDVDADLPVVRYSEGDDPAGLVPCATTTADLLVAVDDAVETYQRRCREAEESEMLRGLLDQLDKSIYFKDEEARVLHHADVGGGPDPEAARGKTDLEIYEDRPLVELSYEDDVRVLDGERIVDREERIPHHDLWMQTTKVPWRDEDGDVRGIIGHTVDVTEYKRQEHRLDELRHRFDTFTNQLRHELKTQLQIALGNLGEGPDAEERNEGKVRRALAEMDRIVEDYESLANGSPAVDGETGPAELRETVAAAWDAVDAEDATLEVDVDAPAFVNAPKPMLRRVVENLLRDLVGTGRDDVALRIGTTDDGFFVENTRQGLPEEKRSVVEQPGFAAAQDGSGRELGIVKDEMDDHVWSLTVGDGEEGGHRFEVADCLVDAERNPAVADGTLASPTGTAAVGTLEAGGSVERDVEANRWRVTGDGDDVFRQDNDFYFVYAELDGRASVQGRVASVEAVSERSKGGFMIRDSLDEDAAYAYLGQTPVHGSEVLWRPTTGANGESRQLDEGAVVFDWYRLDRVDDEVRCYVSMNGRRWQRIDTRSIDVDDPVYVGMVACSTRNGDPCEVVFEDVTIASGGE